MGRLPFDRSRIAQLPACQEALGTTDCSVKILTANDAAHFSSHHEALGQALECSSDHVGCSAYIFYGDVLSLAGEGDAAEYQLLGDALAHEIGHLLLGPNSHTPTGIMPGKWNEQDLQTIARAYLVFTPAQSKRIRDELLTRAQAPLPTASIQRTRSPGGPSSFITVS
jgi:hypothetical protein